MFCIFNNFLLKNVKHNIFLENLTFFAFLFRVKKNLVLKIVVLKNAVPQK